MLKGLDGSTIKYYTALSPTAISAAGSSNPVDLSAATFATLIVDAGSGGAATVNVSVLRSGTSNGTFNTNGASVSASILGNKYVRSFVLGSSAVWHRVFYTATGAGSPSMNIIIAAQGQDLLDTQPVLSLYKGYAYCQVPEVCYI